MLSFHQSSQGGHEYTKGKAETGCLPQLYLAQLYGLSFLLWASTFCFSLKGTVQGSPGLNQGRSRILDLSSGLQMQVKCGHQMSSFVYIITAGGYKTAWGQCCTPFSSMCWTPLLYPNTRAGRHGAEAPRLLPSLRASVQQPAWPFLYPSCQIIVVN